MKMEYLIGVTARIAAIAIGALVFLQDPALAGSKVENQSVHLTIFRVRAGNLHWLFRSLERDPGTSHTADVGYQRYIFGDRRGGVAGGQHRGCIAL